MRSQLDIACSSTGWTQIYRREVVGTKEAFLTNFANDVCDAIGAEGSTTQSTRAQREWSMSHRDSFGTSEDTYGVLFSVGPDGKTNAAEN